MLETIGPAIERGGASLEYRFQHRDGHYIWIQDTFKVICDDAGRPMELVGAWADITERKRAEQEALRAVAELHDTKRYLTRLIESSPDAIVATDREGRIVLFSEGAETMLGYRSDEVLGRSASAALWRRRRHERAGPRDAQARRHGFGSRQRAVEPRTAAASRC